MICKLCNRQILKEVEDYLKIQGFHLGKEEGEPVFFHKICYFNKMEEHNKVGGLLNMVGNMGTKINKLLVDQGY